MSDLPSVPSLPPPFLLPPRPAFPGAVTDRNPIGIVGGGRGGGGGAIGGLKARPKPLKFVEQKLEEESILAHWRTTPLERMRLLDSMRKPSPVSEECTFLNISDRRLDLHVLKDVLNLCGGSAGGRFSVEAFTTARTSASHLQSLWDCMNSAFELLDKVQRKVLLTRDYSIPEEHEHETIKQLRAEVNAASAAAAAAPLPAEGETSTHATVITYHQLADAYTRCVRRVQSLAAANQALLAPSSSFSSSSSSSSTDSDSKGSEPGADDDNCGKPMPDWLQCLIDKWETEGLPVVSYHLANTVVPPVPASAIKLKANTIGKFAAYVACLLTGSAFGVDGNDTTGLEEAMWQLLQGSNDRFLVVSADMSLAAVRALVAADKDIDQDQDSDAARKVAGPGADSSGGKGPGNEGTTEATLAQSQSAAPETGEGRKECPQPTRPRYDRHYWANRFWNFLSRLSELKSRPKDEKGAVLFEIHEPPLVALPPPSEKELADAASRKAAILGGAWLNADCLSR